jgi:hypothetical protein
MAPKPGGYAVLEGIRQEMQRNELLSLFWQSSKPVEISPMGQVIDLYAEFGHPRIPFGTAIEEEWYVGAAAGMAMSGVPCIAHCPYMATVRAFDLVFNQIGKLRHMTGGQASMPMVLWQDGAGRQAGMAGQHSDAGQEALYAAEVATADCDEARELILSNCTTCHAFVPIVLQQFDRNGWNGLLDRHRPRVSQLSEEQIETIGSYLAANFNADMPPPELPPALLEQWTDY